MKRTRPEAGHEEIVRRSKARATGTIVLVVFGLLDEDAPDLRWWTICEGAPAGSTHAGIVGHTTRSDAFEWASHPSDWCPVCQEARDNSNDKAA